MELGSFVPQQPCVSCCCPKHKPMFQRHCCKGILPDSHVVTEAMASFFRSTRQSCRSIILHGHMFSCHVGAAWWLKVWLMRTRCAVNFTSPLRCRPSYLCLTFTVKQVATSSLLSHISSYRATHTLLCHIVLSQANHSQSSSCDTIPHAPVPVNRHCLCPLCTTVAHQGRRTPRLARCKSRGRGAHYRPPQDINPT